MAGKSESSDGYSVYVVAMSTIKATLPLTLMFQKIYERELIGEPSHRRSANKVPVVLLLSNGACRRIPMTGNTQVVILFAISIAPYVAAPRPQNSRQPE